MNEQSMNAPRKAVALNYIKGQDQAPHVSAKGKGLVAEKIINTAKEAGVPVQEDPSLVSMLSGLDLNEMIPPELYGAVAEIFSYIYKIDEKSK